MPNVAVVTDSCATIPEPYVEALKIRWVPYYLHREEEVLRDLINVHREEFYR